MPMLLGIFVAFVALVAMVILGHQNSTSMADKINALQRKKRTLVGQINDLKQATREMKETEVLLSQRTDELSDSDGLDMGSDLITGVKKPKRATAPANSLVDVLLAEKLLSPDQLSKAEAYRQQSKSPYGIDEILAMLGYVSPDVIQRIKNKYPQLS